MKKRGWAGLREDRTQPPSISRLPVCSGLEACPGGGWVCAAMQSPRSQWPPCTLAVLLSWDSVACTALFSWREALRWASCGGGHERPPRWGRRPERVSCPRAPVVHCAQGHLTRSRGPSLRPLALRRARRRAAGACPPPTWQAPRGRNHLLLHLPCTPSPSPSFCE